MFPCRSHTYSIVFASIVALASQALGQAPAHTDLQDFRTRVSKLLLDQNYDELEKTVDLLRRDRPLFIDGGSQLAEFYNVLSEDNSEANKTPLRRAEDRLQLINAWHEAHPTFTTLLLMASTLCNVASAARGTDIANKLTVEAIQKMENASREADNYLQSAETLAKRAKINDPYLYYQGMCVGVLASFSEDKMQTLLNQAMECDPAFDSAIKVMSRYLLPRWYGQEGDLLKLAKRMAQRTRSKTGDAAYAVVAMQAIYYGEISSFSRDGFDWSRVRQGIRDWLKAAPESRYRWASLAKSAHIAGDRETALEALPKINEYWGNSVFWRHSDWLRTDRWARDQLPNNQKQVVIELGPREIADVAFVEGGKSFVVPGHRQLEIRSIPDGAINRVIPLGLHEVRQLIANRSGEQVIFTLPARGESNVCILEVKSGEFGTIGTQDGSAYSLALSPDEKLVAVGNDRGSVRRWPTTEPLVPYEWPAKQSDKINGLAFSPDSTQLASVSGTQLKTWHIPTREEWNAWKVHDSSVYTVAWSPTDKIIATGGWGNEVKLWSTADTALLATFLDANASIQSLCFSPDGKRLVAGTMSAEQPQIPGEVIVWDMETKRPLITFSGHRMVCGTSRSHRTVAKSRRRATMERFASGPCLNVVFPGFKKHFFADNIPDGSMIAGSDNSKADKQETFYFEVFLAFLKYLAMQ